jgi:hypothetical protein
MQSMDGQRFDRVARSLAAATSRRRVLAGLGLAATGSLLAGQAAVEAAPSARATCMKACNAEAKTERQGCAELKSRAKNTCLRGVQLTRAECRADCVEDGEGGV